MTNDIRITIRGTQAVDGESETIETVQSGTYRSLPDMDVVMYEEIAVAEEGAPISMTKNIIKIQPDQIVVIKKGAAQTEMHFVKGECYHGFYQTPYGVFDMVIRTSALDITQTEKRMDLTIQYALELNGMAVSDCTMEIQIESDVR